MQSLQVLAQAQAAHMAAQVQTAAQQQAGGQQPGGPGADGSQSEPAGFTYRNRARRKASEKPHVSPDVVLPLYRVPSTGIICRLFYIVVAATMGAWRRCSFFLDYGFSSK